MARDLFRDVVHPSIKVGTKQWYTVPASILVHTIAVLGLIVVPLLASNLLPTPQSVLAFAALPAPPPPPSPPPAPSPTSVETRPMDVIRDAAPPEAATRLSLEPKLLPSPPRLTANRAVDGGLPRDSKSVKLDAPPPPAPQVHRIGGDIKEPRLITRIEPAYPAVAKVAKMQGPVYVEAIIGRDGRVRDARAVSGAPYPPLREAAVAAVQQWIYSPTTLNGQPVDVQLSVVVHFQLK